MKAFIPESTIDDLRIDRTIGASSRRIIIEAFAGGIAQLVNGLSNRFHADSGRAEKAWSSNGLRRRYF
jgi:hypothetical protein